MGYRPHPPISLRTFFWVSTPAPHLSTGMSQSSSVGLGVTGSLTFFVCVAACPWSHGVKTGFRTPKLLGLFSGLDVMVSLRSVTSDSRLKLYTKFASLCNHAQPPCTAAPSLSYPTPPFAATPSLYINICIY